MLAIDDLSAVVRHLLTSGSGGNTEERRATTEALLRWLLRNGRIHRQGVGIIVTRRVTLNPISHHPVLVTHPSQFTDGYRFPSSVLEDRLTSPL